MSGPRSGQLYTPEMLSLATGLAAYPSDAELPFHGCTRSETCGGTLSVDFSLAEDRVEKLGLAVSACAVGQAAAALFADWAPGQTIADITAAHERLAGWLAGEGDPPREPNLAPIEAARDFPARHGAILLPWRAFEDALSNADAAR